jgi:hypothetical protein
LCTNFTHMRVLTLLICVYYLHLSDRYTLVPLVFRAMLLARKVKVCVCEREREREREVGRE